MTLRCCWSTETTTEISPFRWPELNMIELPCCQATFPCHEFIRSMIRGFSRPVSVPLLKDGLTTVNPLVPSSQQKVQNCLMVGLLDSKQYPRECIGIPADPGSEAVLISSPRASTRVAVIPQKRFLVSPCSAGVYPFDHSERSSERICAAKLFRAT